eukprot:SAG11_NODE_2549_length_3231_cov_3.053640_2_plen_237_part_00
MPAPSCVGWTHHRALRRLGQSESDASSLTRCGKPALESFIRILCGMLRKEAWLQAEACSIFAGMCQMDTKMFADVVNKDWFVISILRMLREPPDEQTLTIMLDVLKNVVAHESSRAENIAWLCTPSVIEICLAMVTSPFHDSCMALTQLMVRNQPTLSPERECMERTSTLTPRKRWIGRSFMARLAVVRWVWADPDDGSDTARTCGARVIRQDGDGPSGVATLPLRPPRLNPDLEW